MVSRNLAARPGFSTCAPRATTTESGATSRTITELDELKKALAEIRERGWAFDREELVDGEVVAGHADAGDTRSVCSLDVVGRVTDDKRLGGRYRFAIDQCGALERDHRDAVRTVG